MPLILMIIQQTQSSSLFANQKLELRTNVVLMTRVFPFIICKTNCQGQADVQDRQKNNHGFFMMKLRMEVQSSIGGLLILQGHLQGGIVALQLFQSRHPFRYLVKISRIAPQGLSSSLFTQRSRCSHKRPFQGNLSIVFHNAFNFETHVKALLLMWVSEVVHDEFSVFSGFGQSGLHFSLELCFLHSQLQVYKVRSTGRRNRACQTVNVTDSLRAQECECVSFCRQPTQVGELCKIFYLITMLALGKFLLSLLKQNDLRKKFQTKHIIFLWDQQQFVARSRSLQILLLDQFGKLGLNSYVQHLQRFLGLQYVQIQTLLVWRVIKTTLKALWGRASFSQMGVNKLQI